MHEHACRRPYNACVRMCRNDFVDGSTKKLLLIFIVAEPSHNTIGVVEITFLMDVKVSGQSQIRVLKVPETNEAIAYTTVLLVIALLAFALIIKGVCPWSSKTVLTSRQ